MRQVASTSSIDTSTSSPLPITSPVPAARRRRSAVIAPTAATTPESHSPICPPTYIGARSGDPRPSPTIAPDHACNVNSVAGFSLHGPSRPNGVIDTTTRPGSAPTSSSGAIELSSATVDPGDRTTTSAAATRSCRASTSVAFAGSTTVLRLDAPRCRNSAPSSPWAIDDDDADQRRSGSPSGASTFVTSAPPSASNFVQYAPAIHVDRSMTRSPLSGDGPVELLVIGGSSVTRSPGVSGPSGSTASPVGSGCRCLSPSR